MRSKISVIIPAWNEANILEKCFYFLNKLRLPFDYSELILIAGGKDNTFNICESYSFKNFDKVKVLKQKHDDFKSGALLKGLEASEGLFITLLDADTLVSRKFMVEIVKSLKNFDIVNANYIPMLRKGFWYDYYIIKKLIWAQNPKNLPSLFGASTITFKRKIAEKIGFKNLFSKKSKAGVDHYMGVVFRENDIKIGFADKAKVITPRPGNIIDFYRDQMRWFSAFFKLHWNNKRLIFITLALSLSSIIVPPIIFLFNLLKIKPLLKINHYKSKYYFVYFLVEYILNILRLKTILQTFSKRTRKIGHFKGSRY